MKRKVEIGRKRYLEMEARKERFMEKYVESGDSLYLDLVKFENEDMGKLALAIMKAELEINKK